MKLSFHSLAQSIHRLAAHYPLMIVLLLGALVIGLDAIRSRELLPFVSDDSTATAFYLCLVAILGGAGAYAMPKTYYQITHIGIIALLLLRYLLLPTTLYEQHILSFVVVGCISIFRLLWGPLHQPTTRQLYHHTARILEHSAIGVLFALLLGLGLAGALAAIQALFDISIQSERYPTIALFAGLGVGVVSLLDGILFADTSKGQLTHAKRQTIAAWTIAILLLLYGAILLVYLIKILITGVRPSNAVTLWSFVFIALVLIATTLQLPLLDVTEKQKMIIRRGVHIALLPILAMSAIAIYQRVAQYGFTTQRYLVIMIIIIVGAHSIYQIIVSRATNYLLLIALSIGGIISVFGGPLSASQLSYQSQYDRLTDYLYDQGLYTGSTLSVPLTGLNTTQEQTIAAMVRYFQYKQGRGLPQLAPALANPDTLFDVLGIAPSVAPLDTTYKHFSSQQSGKVDISGYSSFYSHVIYSDRSDESQSNSFAMSGDHTLLFLAGDTTLLLDIDTLVNKLDQTDGDPELTPEEAIITTPDARYLIHSINLRQHASDWDIEHADISIFVQ